MVKVLLPPISQKLVDDSGQAVKEWYDKLKFLERLQPLSDVVFPAVPASVTSIDTATGDFTLGYGLSRSTQSLLANLTSITASLGADVLLNNVANYFDGPSVAQGTTGTWLVFGTVTITAPTAATMHAKLWDGTTVIASCADSVIGNGFCPIALSGFITSPAADLRISVKDIAGTTGKILFNQTANSKDSAITAVRIA